MWSDSSDGIDMQDQTLLPLAQVEREEQKISTKMIVSLAGVLLLTVLIILGLILWSSKRADLPSLDPTVAPVIILSIDGFRYSYLTQYGEHIPTLLSIASKGIQSPLQPIFPSKTFPNHFSIATGLYPESHGVVSNTFYDPIYNETFKVGNTQQQKESKWWNGEPFWITARKNNYNSAVHYWPGSETSYNNIRPTYWSSYNKSTTNQDRVNKVIEWMSLPIDSRPMITAFYFDSVDTQGHAEGPDHVARSLKGADEAIASLLDGLNKIGLKDKFNLLIVSDHGMTDVSPNRVVMIDQYIEMDTITVVDWSPICAIIPKDMSKIDEIVNKLSNAPNVHVYRKDQIPSRYFYNDNRRITPIIIVAEEGYSISTTTSFLPQYATGGAHGYDNQLLNMTAIMIGYGPTLKRAYKSSVIENIHVYELINSMLDMTPAPNNGSREAINHLFNDGV